MQTINITELRNHLSLYLRKVRTSEQVIVCNRNIPIARIIPWRDTKHNDRLLTLANQGALRLGNGHDFWQLPAPRVSKKALHDALGAERNNT